MFDNNIKIPKVANRRKPGRFSYLKDIQEGQSTTFIDKITAQNALAYMKRMYGYKGTVRAMPEGGFRLWRT